MTIKDPSGSPKGEAVTIMRYFRQECESTQAFNEQLKQLSPEAKTELAIGAAKEMGWTVEP